MDRFYIEVPNERWFEENIGCENACPVNTRAPHYISAIREEDYNLAFELNRGDNLFPAILGRICVHPCEEKCRRGLLIDCRIFFLPSAFNNLRLYDPSLMAVSVHSSIQVPQSTQASAST